MTKDKILETEYSNEFDELRKNRVAMSFYKYGSASINYGEGLVDAIESAVMCIDKARKTKNSEYLVDAANYCMFGFMYAKGYEFKATDSGESASKAGISVNELKEMRG